MNRNVHVPFLGEGQWQHWLLTRLKAIVTTGKKVGTYVGRVAVRASGRFNITTQSGTIQGIGYQHCTTIHTTDGYSYS